MDHVSDRGRSRLLRPSWLVLHVLLAVALVVMVRLGAWQWGRGVELDSIRNYGYGLEWWAFAALSLIGWVKFCLDETAPAAEPEREPEQEAAHPRPVARVDDEDDPELAAWNARFAELAARDAEAS